MDLVARAKAILLTPSSEWGVIDTEPTTVSSLYTGYIIPLSLIPPLASFVGLSVLGYNIAGVSIKLSLSSGIERAVVQFVTGLAMPFVLALIIDGLAPSFGGQKSQIQALKVAAYSSTAFWIAGIFALLPTLAILTILGLYSLYLFYVGLPILMKAPQDKAMPYTVVVIICAIVVAIVLGLITSAIVPMPGVGRLVP